MLGYNLFLYNICKFCWFDPVFIDLSRTSLTSLDQFLAILTGPGLWFLSSKYI